MTQVASPGSVVGDFDDVNLATMGSTFHLGREDDHFWVELPGTSLNGDSPLRRQIALCTGSHHMQVYWYPVGESRILAQLPFVYLKEAHRWIPRNAAFLRPPQQQPTDEIGRWNQTCIKCHTTGARPAIEDAEHMNSHVAEFGIACEACHGPASSHVASGGRAVVEVVNPSALSKQKSSEVCAQCHSVAKFASDAAREHWQEHGFEYRPGGDFADERSIIHGRSDDLQGLNLGHVSLVASTHWRDGMVRVAGREYNGLLETPCHQRGEMSCLSCHSMHKADDDPRTLVEWADDQLKVGMRSNAACTQCHKKYLQDETIAVHTHHAASSSGSVCYNCHMPYTSYGLLKATRSHHITNPSVAASVAMGRPNACNQCHLDKTLDWTARWLSDWYDISAPPLSADQRSYVASALWALQGDAVQRALMAWSFAWEPAQQASGDDWLVPLLARLMNDPYDAVRYIAYRSLRTIEGYEDFDFDFLGSPPDREKAIRRLSDLWEDQVSQQSTPRMGASLLLNVDGSERDEVVDRLIRARDNRPLTLVE